MPPILISFATGSVAPTPASTLSVTSQVAPDMWRQRLDRMSRLQDNWDLDGAPAPTPQAIGSAAGFLSALRENGVAPARLAPSVIGGVGLTSQAGVRMAYVEFLNNGRACLLLGFDDDRDDEPTTRKFAPTTDAFREIAAAIRGHLHA